MKKPDPFFVALCEKHGIPRPQPEWRFHAERKWRFDYSWPDRKVALEVEGASFGTGKPCQLCGQRKAGAHTRGGHFRSDMEKYNAAAVLGWRVLRCTPEHLYAKDVTDMIAALVLTPEPVGALQLKGG